MSVPAGKLYVVSTPIGNLKDITFRAVEALKEADVILCEDTRHSKTLFHTYGIHKPTESYFEGNEKARVPGLIERLKEGQTIAIITDAGTPGIQDPGYRLIHACSAEGIPVLTVPGPSAVIAALSISGLPTDRFVFEGFLPVKPGQRNKTFERWKAEERTVIFYESPYKLIKHLTEMKEAMGDIRIVVARELTKKFEEVVQGRISEILEKFSRGKVLGEFVILFHLAD